MPEDGSNRPSPLRRLLLALARAAALFILVTGIYGALTIGLPRTSLPGRAIGSLVAGVVTYEFLRRPRRAVQAAAAEPGPAVPPPDNTAELLEAQNAIDQLRAEAQAARGREAQAREQYERESEHLQRAASRAVEEIQRIRTSNDELRGRAETQNSAVEQLRGQIESERRQTAELRAAVEKERTRAAAFEMQRVETEKRAGATAQELEAMRAERQRARRDVEEAKQRAEVEKAAQRKTLESEWSAKLKDVQRELELTRSSAKQLLQANEALSRQLDEERQRLHAELQRIIAESKSERDEMQEEARAVAARLQELLAQLERERQLSRELASTRAAIDEENTSLKNARRSADAELASLRQTLQSREQREQELTQQIASVRGEHQAKLQRLASDHEADFGKAIAERDEARAETQSLSERVAQLERDHEAKLLQIDIDWGEKLQKIVAGLAIDHETDVGKTIEEREEARAEVRSLNQRIAKLEQDKAALNEQLATRPGAGVDEAALREQIDAQWSAKLQTIVSHLAADHEADVGKAIEEREAARAELRNLNIKMTSLQQRLDAERQARDSLQSRMREAEETIRNAPTQPMPAMQEALPLPPPPPPEEQRARADVLQFAEQAYEAMRRATSPGDVPVPASAQKRGRVLIVHHDPTLRSMWRESLGKNGFEVQTAADGLEGLRVVKTEKPDVVIADASMPKMDGRELCQLIKSNPETAGVKVILMTGVYTNEVPLDTAKNEFEPDELLRKPVKVDAMKAALNNLLAARAAS